MGPAGPALPALLCISQWIYGHEEPLENQICKYLTQGHAHVKPRPQRHTGDPRAPLSAHALDGRRGHVAQGRPAPGGGHREPGSPGLLSPSLLSRKPRLCPPAHAARLPSGPSLGGLRSYTHPAPCPRARWARPRPTTPRAPPRLETSTPTLHSRPCPPSAPFPGLSSPHRLDSVLGLNSLLKPPVRPLQPALPLWADGLSPIS